MKKSFIVLTVTVTAVLLGFSLSFAQAKPGWPKSVTIGAAPVGGTYYIWAGGFAKLLHDKMGIPGNVEVTGDVHATGSIMDDSGNTNHHGH